MTTETDFLAFYQQLQIPATCSVGELKNAYRRRIAELHPDRNLAGQGDPAAALRLQELTAAYSAVMAFERRYGRLPGAVRPVPSGLGSGIPNAGRSARQAGGTPPAVTVAQPRRILLTLSILAALVWALSTPDERGDDGPDKANGTDAGRTVTSATMPPPPLLPIDLGTAAGQVRAIEGEPVAANRQHWDYGPSWIEFEDDRVSNWYSSPQRPLHVASPRPERPPGPPLHPDPLD